MELHAFDASLRWRRPMMMPSAVSAEISSDSGRHSPADERSSACEMCAVVLAADFLAVERVIRNPMELAVGQRELVSFDSLELRVDGVTVHRAIESQ